jgi:putative transcriptional regulator
MEAYPKYNRIAEVLEEQGRSQKWLAQKLSISTNALNNLCQQRSQPSLPRLFEIAEILSVDPCTLIHKRIKKK